MAWDGYDPKFASPTPNQAINSKFYNYDSKTRERIPSTGSDTTYSQVSSARSWDHGDVPRRLFRRNLQRELNALHGSDSGYSRSENSSTLSSISTPRSSITSRSSSARSSVQEEHRIFQVNNQRIQISERDLNEAGPSNSRNFQNQDKAPRTVKEQKAQNSFLKNQPPNYRLVGNQPKYEPVSDQPLRPPKQQTRYAFSRQRESDNNIFPREHDPGRRVQFQQMKERSRENWLRNNAEIVRPKIQQQGAAESGLEWGANKDLANQQHGFDLESMKEYFNGLSEQQKELLAGQIDQIREQFKGQQGLQESQHEHELTLQEQIAKLQEQLQGNQLEHEKESQSSQQKHESGLQESSQQFTKEEADRQRQYERQMRNTMLSQGGNISAALAGISPVQSSPTIGNSGTARPSDKAATIG